MSTLLMIESWLNSTGRALPPILRELGHEYVLVTRDLDLYPPGPDGLPHPVLRYASEVVRIETNDIRALLAGAVDIASRRRVDGVLTTCDYYLESVAVVAQRLGLPGEDPQVVRATTRKDRVRAILAATGIPDVAHAVVPDWEGARKAAADLGYPLVAKPVDLNSGTGVRCVAGEDELAEAFRTASRDARNSRDQGRTQVLLLEKFLAGQELSVETMTRRGVSTVLAVTDKSLTAAPAFVESGHMVPARLTPEVTTAVTELVLATLSALGVTHGLAHTEVMVTAEGPRIVEVNPRQGGGSIFELVALVTGSNPLKLLIDLALDHGTGRGDSTVPVTDGRMTVGSAAIMFVMSPEPADVEAIVGTDRLDADPAVLGWSIPVPARAPQPVDNSAYLGHVVAIDPDGHHARARAEAAVAGLRLRARDGRLLRPLGVPSGLA
ncbi:MAG: ATP-grasp domain-containing protein [Dermatophilaceae bacterium]